MYFITQHTYILGGVPSLGGASLLRYSNYDISTTALPTTALPVMALLITVCLIAESQLMPTLNGSRRAYTTASLQWAMEGLLYTYVTFHCILTTSRCMHIHNNIQKLTHTYVHTPTSSFLASVLNTSLREWLKASVKDTVVLTVSPYDTVRAYTGTTTWTLHDCHIRNS